jgi:8-oxo-dGTP pyrophosphatase MutT (NUDIX family)
VLLYPDPTEGMLLVAQQKCLLPPDRADEEGALCLWGGAVEPTDASVEAALSRELSEELPLLIHLPWQLKITRLMTLGPCAYYLGILDPAQRSWRAYCTAAQEGIGVPVRIAESVFRRWAHLDFRRLLLHLAAHVERHGYAHWEAFEQEQANS